MPSEGEYVKVVLLVMKVECEVSKVQISTYYSPTPPVS